MTPEEIQRLVCSLSETETCELKETTLSWVLLTPSHVYKIKKPHQLSYVDMREMVVRKAMCKQELDLNRRTAPDIYLGVKPIYQRGACFSFKGPGDIRDYAVYMRRLDNRFQADLMVGQADHTPLTSQLESLGHTLTCFHQTAQQVHPPDPVGRQQADFNNILSLLGDYPQWLTQTQVNLIQQAVEMSDYFLSLNQESIKRRGQEGWIRDVHGDLHLGNIFLTEPPTLFDCLELDAGLRQIDILNELAFPVMDLEAHGRRDLAEILVTSYLESWPIVLSPFEQQLLAYFKLYRANVRAKVLTCQLAQIPKDPSTALKQQRDTYFVLMHSYLSHLMLTMPPSSHFQAVVEG